MKKLGRIPDGGGHRKLGRQTGRRNRSGMGYAYLHHAVDDHPRLAYSDILDDERRETAAEFWTRANVFFADHWIVVKRVLTDNGSVTGQSFSLKHSASTLLTRRPGPTVLDQRESREIRLHPSGSFRP